MATGKKTIKIEQVASAARRHHDQRETLIGLKLNKVGRTSEMPDTPQTHGMIRKLSHLVRVVTK
jgi:large subunit ribosomal protein L30